MYASPGTKRRTQNLTKTRAPRQWLSERDSLCALLLLTRFHAWQMKRREEGKMAVVELLPLRHCSSRCRQHAAIARGRSEATSLDPRNQCHFTASNSAARGGGCEGTKGGENVVGFIRLATGSPKVASREGAESEPDMPRAPIRREDRSSTTVGCGVDRS